MPPDFGYVRLDCGPARVVELDGGTAVGVYVDAQPDVEATRFKTEVKAPRSREERDYGQWHLATDALRDSPAIAAVDSQRTLAAGRTYPGANLRS